MSGPKPHGTVIGAEVGSIVQAPTTPVQEKAVIAADAAKAVETERTSLGQRRVNLIWEVTQLLIALSVVGSTLAVTVVLVLRDSTESATAFVLIAGLANLVIGFYFGRTNHQRVGGVGSGSEVSGR